MKNRSVATVDAVIHEENWKFNLTLLQQLEQSNFGIWYRLFSNRFTTDFGIYHFCIGYLVSGNTIFNIGYSPTDFGILVFVILVWDVWYLVIQYLIYAILQQILVFWYFFCIGYLVIQCLLSDFILSALEAVWLKTPLQRNVKRI